MNNLPSIPMVRPRKHKATLNPFIPPKPLTISRARKVMTTLAWRGVETPISLLSELTGYSSAQIRKVLSNIDTINDYLDAQILTRKVVSRNGHYYYLASVHTHSALDNNFC